MSHRGPDRETSDPFVSTGTLPPPDRVRQLMEEAFERYRGNEEGATSRVYPALGRVSPQLFGLCVMGANGDRYESGDADVEFSIMSVSKPFVFALVCNALGSDRVRDFVGVNATGLPFNSIEAIGLRDDGRTNPMVNAGAIATSSLVPGSTAEARWHAIQTGLSRCAGRTLEIDEEIFASATATNDRNRSIVEVLASSDRLVGQASEVLDLYTRQSSLRVTARDLAVMGATIADGGVNPLTHERVVDAASCRATLATMTTAGLYETSGDWLFDVGLPGKSGIGGGIVTVSPGKGALGTYAPLLDDAGNSVKGQLAARFLSQRLGLDLFASEPAR